MAIAEKNTGAPKCRSSTTAFSIRPTTPLERAAQTTSTTMTKAGAALQAEGLPTTVEEQTSCCYAVQDKVWVHGPDAEPWEVYTVLADAPAMAKVAAEPVTLGRSCC